MTAKIDSFSGPHHFLSNFYVLPEPIEWDGLSFTTTEHAFQAAKFADVELRKKVRDCKKPGDAKRMGRELKPLRHDWEATKINVMEAILCVKFNHPILMKWLLETGDAELIEANTWKDSYWGVYKGKGRNELGKALMRVRAAIRSTQGGA